MSLRKKRSKKGYFSRQQLAQQMGVTLRTVTNWHIKGILRGEKMDRQWWYTPEEVHEAKLYLAASRPMGAGERTARAFELFRDGKQLADVVVALRITTAMTLQLWREYSPGGVFLDSSVVEELDAILRKRGIVASGASGILNAILTLCERDAQLERLRLRSAG